MRSASHTVAAAGVTLRRSGPASTRGLEPSVALSEVHGIGVGLSDRSTLTQSGPHPELRAYMVAVMGLTQASDNLWFRGSAKGCSFVLTDSASSFLRLPRPIPRAPPPFKS